MIRFERERQSVVDVCHRLSDSGYLAGTGGNVALRLDGEHFAVTPSATDYAVMTAADIAVLKLATSEQVDGNRPPSIERFLHAELLKARPERKASIHTHQPIASAVALLHERLDWRPGVDKARFGRSIELVPYRPSGTGMLVKALRNAIRVDVHAYLMASHGVIAVAADFAEGCAMVGEIEAAAARFLSLAISGNRSLDPVVAELITSGLSAAQHQTGA